MVQFSSAARGLGSYRSREGGFMALDSFRRFAGRLLPRPKGPESIWRSPVVLDRGPLGEACVALDGRGHGAALWENGGALWIMPVGPHCAAASARLPLGEGSTPQILLNAEGQGVALWRTGAPGALCLYGQVVGAGRGPAHLLVSTEGSIRHLQAAVDRRGNALVIWLQEREGLLEVMALTYDIRAGAWDQEPTCLARPSTPTVEPRIAVNHREHAMVLWETDDGADEGLVASHYWSSEGIWSDRPVPVVNQSTHAHRVAMDDEGNALAIWIHAPYGQRSSIQASHYDGGRCEWSKAETLCTAHTLTQTRLVMSGSGQALAAWCQAEERGATRLVSKGFGGGCWEPGVECLDLGHEPVREFALDLGADGQAGVLTVHRSAEGDWVSARLRRQGWSPSVRLVSPSARVCSAPLLKLCPQGASALWTQGVGLDRALVLAETW